MLHPHHEIVNPRSIENIDRLAIHTQTNKPWSLGQCIDAYSAIGVKGISVWRHVLEPMGAKAAGQMLRDAGMRVPALVRGGFLTATDVAGRQKAMDANRVCIDEAYAIGAEMVVLVVGPAMPGTSLEEARKQVADSIDELLDDAQGAKVKLAIEPLHPMYAGDKSCINRMAEARAICGELNHPLLGIAVDLYHVWWDPDLKSQIEWAGKHQKLFASHICDWRVETRSVQADRGLMGDGCIDIRKIRGWVEHAGFTGFHEVEVFSEAYWAMDQAAYLQLMRERYLNNT